MQKHVYKYYLALLAAAPPLATDMYLPAMPYLAEHWGVPVSQVNLSLVLWFVAYSFSLLVWGSLSDRFGRRPILLCGLSLFILSSGLCAVAQDVWQLIAARVFQGIAAAGGASMSMAIARDRFEGKERQQVLAWIGVILGLAPMLAPSLGALLMEHASWRLVFLVQAGIAVVSLVATLQLYQETIPELQTAGVRGLLASFGRLMKNSRFMLANGATGLLSAPLLGFVAFSPIAYIQHYGMNERQFGLIFGVNALCVIAGSACCARLIRHHNEYRLLSLALTGCLLGGIGVLLTGAWGWEWFAAGMAVFAFAFGMSRPLVNHLILEQVNRDIGVAASMVICYQFLCGAIGMAVATLDWSQPFLAFGLIMTICPLITLLLWPLILSQRPH